MANRPGSFVPGLPTAAASCFARALAASSKGGCALLGRGAQGIITREQRWHERMTNTERRSAAHIGNRPKGPGAQMSPFLWWVSKPLLASFIFFGT